MNTQQIMRYIFVKIRSFSIVSCVIKIKNVYLQQIKYASL